MIKQYIIHKSIYNSLVKTFGQRDQITLCRDLFEFCVKPIWHLCSKSSEYNLSYTGNIYFAISGEI